MKKREFIKIMNKGYDIKYTIGKRSQLICFRCGERTAIVRQRRKFKVKCKNRHTYSLMDYLISHTTNRNGLLIKQIENQCAFNFRR